jgi:ketosteroid isomerase-like protein
MTSVVANRALDLYEASRTLAPRAGGEAVEEHYRGLHIYRRQPDGTWRIAQEIWNTLTPRGGT